VAPPAQDPPAQRPAQDQPAPAAPPAGLGAPGGDGEVRSQADLERRVGEEVTLEGERHERAGVEVIVVRRIEADQAAAPGASDQPQQAPMPWLEQDADDQAQQQDAIDQSQQDADDEGGFDFDW
jgi:hypothetical protein